MKDYALQAIVTKFVPATNTKGSRISAKSYGKRMLVSWDYSLDVFENHAKAALDLANSLGWLEKNDLHAGAMPDGTGYCFVLVEKK